MRYFIFLAWLHCTSWGAPLTVLIDPGHGGRDRGTTRQDVHEAQITLEVANDLRALLQKNSQFEVRMTRSTDTTISLNERSRLAKANEADIFVSIHVNSSPDLHARGAEFYFQNQLPPDEESMYLAHQEEQLEGGNKTQPMVYPTLDPSPYSAEVTAILKDLLDGSRVQRSSDLIRSLRSHWTGPHKSQSSGIHQAPFHVLSQMHVPSVLVELGFLTNPRDYQLLVNSAEQKKMAGDIYRGLVAYKESLDKGRQYP
jgi:N-acetylmuramoyl-L-alanine amidase